MKNVKEIKQWARTFLSVELKIFEDEQFIKIYKIVVPKPNRKEGAGTLVMENIIDYANKNGKVIILTPASDFGGNVRRLTKWYKSLGFVYNKPRMFEITDLMYKLCK